MDNENNDGNNKNEFQLLKFPNDKLKLQEAAAATYDLYKQFRDAGFTENQAMTILLTILTNSIK